MRSTEQLRSMGYNGDNHDASAVNKYTVPEVDTPETTNSNTVTPCKDEPVIDTVTPSKGEIVDDDQIQ